MKQLNIKITIWNNKIKFKFKSWIRYFSEIQVKLIEVKKFLAKFKVDWSKKILAKSKVDSRIALFHSFSGSTSYWWVHRDVGETYRERAVQSSLRAPVRSGDWSRCYGMGLREGRWVGCEWGWNGYGCWRSGKEGWGGWGKGWVRRAWWVLNGAGTPHEFPDVRHSGDHRC